MKFKLESTRFPNSYYQKSGNGYPIVLIHGFGEDGRIWKNQLVDLEKNYTCIIPDLPGSGQSELPSNEIPKTILLGHSMGGYIALAFAEKNAQLLDGFGLVHSSAYADDEIKKENRRKSIKLIENEGKEIFLKAMIPNLYSEISKQTKIDQLAFHLTMALECSSLSLVAYYNAMINRPDRTSVLRQANIPILFVLGTEDTAVPIQHGLTQSAIPSYSQVEVLEQIGHTSMLENPEKLNSILNSFCKCALEYKIA
jgi:pimeloyl-ACP methyl ester carboxylesterase